MACRIKKKINIKQHLIWMHRQMLAAIAIRKRAFVAPLANAIWMQAILGACQIQQFHLLFCQSIVHWGPCLLERLCPVANMQQWQDSPLYKCVNIYNTTVHSSGGSISLPLHAAMMAFTKWWLVPWLLSGISNASMYRIAPFHSTMISAIPRHSASAFVLDTVETKCIMCTARRNQSFFDEILTNECRCHSSTTLPITITMGQSALFLLGTSGSTAHNCNGSSGCANCAAINCNSFWMESTSTLGSALVSVKLKSCCADCNCLNALYTWNTCLSILDSAMLSITRKIVSYVCSLD